MDESDYMNEYNQQVNKFSTMPYQQLFDWIEQVENWVDTQEGNFYRYGSPFPPNYYYWKHVYDIALPIYQARKNTQFKRSKVGSGIPQFISRVRDYYEARRRANNRRATYGW